MGPCNSGDVDGVDVSMPLCFFFSASIGLLAILFIFPYFKSIYFLPVLPQTNHTHTTSLFKLFFSFLLLAAKIMQIFTTFGNFLSAAEIT